MNEISLQEGQIKELLIRHWKLRYDMVGEQSVDDLVRALEQGHPEGELFQRFEGGADFDLSQAFKTLVEAATFLKTCIEIYKLIRAKKGGKPTVGELEKEVRATKTFDRVKSRLTKKKFHAILGDVID